MSKPNGKRYRLETVKRSYVDAVGGERVEFEVGPEDDPRVFHFPHPIFTPDDMQRELNSAQGDEPGARILLGDQYDEFIAAGGDVNSLMLLYVGIRGEAQDTVQKVRPTRG
ncbi:hypothetical protein [Streptomyces mirabilis]|uniref:hypothetical protein n=1 Tax=Streptomyces mirabilis TaxID=68239 RepID=UPI00225372C8|nr:hypothetical protein [Streptomyces mirabilis]MCX4606993.1 hypothetical protein [Streptomyces mirabilis]